VSGTGHHQESRPATLLGLEAGIVTPAADALAAFYRDGLGFELVDRLEFPQGLVLRLRSGPAALKLYQPADGARPGAVPEPWHRDAGFTYAALHVADVDAAHHRAGAHGAATLAPPTAHRPGARYALIADPEGNIVELLEEQR
jgi:catechol 2,3-dioxygenase-like lactoylglutathione lyase family enzyme